jgi:MFS family permease
MMIITNLLQALTISLYLFVMPHHIFILYVLVFMYSFLDQLYLPAQQASIPSLVNKDLLSSANGIFFLTQQFSLLIGFGFGGLLLAIVGRQNTTILSSIFLFVAAAAVFLLPRDWAKKKRIRTDWGAYLNDWRKGYVFVRANRAVMYPLFMIAFAQMFITIISVVLPSYARNVLGLDINYASAAFLVPGAIGAIILTYYLPRVLKKRRKKVFIELGFFISSLSLYALAFLSHAGRFKFILAVLIAVGIGLSIASIIVPSQTLLQEKTPEWFRGRVYASLSFLLIIATSVPLLISAAVADVFGVATMIGVAATILFIGLLFVRREGDYVLANGFGI